MKTHELAKHMAELARTLRKLPNVELSELKSLSGTASRVRNSAELALNVSTLAALSKIEKAEWASFIAEHGLPISIRDRDASRDVLGKLLNYLERNPKIARSIRNSAAHGRTAGSPELSKALNILLGDD